MFYNVALLNRIFLYHGYEEFSDRTQELQLYLTRAGIDHQLQLPVTYDGLLLNLIS